MKYVNGIFVGLYKIDEMEYEKKQKLDLICIQMNGSKLNSLSFLSKFLYIWLKD